MHSTGQATVIPVETAAIIRKGVDLLKCKNLAVIL